MASSRWARPSKAAIAWAVLALSVIRGLPHDDSTCR
jgi:hypothetical protein